MNRIEIPLSKDACANESVNDGYRKKNHLGRKNLGDGNHLAAKTANPLQQSVLNLLAPLDESPSGTHGVNPKY
jgi:hypothetical protein